MIELKEYRVNTINPAGEYFNGIEDTVYANYFQIEGYSIVFYKEGRRIVAYPCQWTIVEEKQKV